MTRNLDLNNSNNWESIYTYSASAGILSDKSYIPIASVDTPVFLESDIIAVFCNTVIPNGRKWRFAGNLEQRFQTGLTVGGNSDAAGQQYPMWVNKITTYFFPSITSNYSLRFYFPSWFKSVQLICWQYTGIDVESADISLAEDFSNINYKLDLIGLNVATTKELIGG